MPKLRNCLWAILCISINFSKFFEFFQIKDLNIILKCSLISREPTSTTSLKRCNNSTFQRGPETICDYQLFENGSSETSSNILKTDTKFNVERMKFWDKILYE